VARRSPERDFRLEEVVDLRCVTTITEVVLERRGLCGGGGASRQREWTVAQARRGGAYGTNAESRVLQ
jgi:hypothetical protein